MLAIRPFLTTVLLTTIFAMQSLAQSQPLPEILLWPDGAPGARGSAPTDKPSITPYIAPNPVGGTAVIVLPGGGYANLSMVNEGSNFALWLNQNGITAFVLKYRLGTNGYRHPTMLQDVSRAVRMVRAEAEKWKIDPTKLGVMGSSAGGHLASSVVTHFDAGNPNATDPIEKMSSRPDFGILCYPVITMGAKTHAGSKRNLIGDDASPELVKEMSSELQVTAQTPPCFIWHGINDRVVPVENAIDFALALKQNNVPFDLHLYQNAPHGQGIGDRPPYTRALPWTADLLLWMKTNKLLPVEAAAPATRPATRPGT